jgi:hypothetical protein
MSQNRSHAVMSQRVEAHDSLDHFPTPPWATRALCEWLKGNPPQTPKALMSLMSQSCWEPACAEGYMARALAEYFGYVKASDVHDYGFGERADFLWPCGYSYDWIITNPPFRLADQFALKALELSRHGVALLVRTAFLESAERYLGLFKSSAPSDILQFVERVPMFKGRLDRTGSTATAYCWLVWRGGVDPGTWFHWLAPCRKRLGRDSDYPTVRAAE